MPIRHNFKCGYFFCHRITGPYWLEVITLSNNRLHSGIQGLITSSRERVEDKRREQDKLREFQGGYRGLL